MSHSLSPARRSVDRDPADLASEPAVAPWLTVVSNSVQSIRYGVVQIVIHDSRVVQVERTERTRFDVPQSPAGR